MARSKPAVIVNLDVRGNADTYSYRTFILHPPAYAMSVGRASRSGDGKLVATENNGWFDSRVVSREHAVIRASPDMKAVFVEDIGSMHGTFVNDRKVKPKEKEMLASGDSLRFGADVSRGPENFPPLRAVIEYHWTEDNKPDLGKDLKDVFEISDDEEEDNSDVEIIQESVRNPETYQATPSRTFSVPDSDMSAAGSFISSDDEMDNDEQDYLPPSARTMMRVLNKAARENNLDLDENEQLDSEKTPTSDSIPPIEASSADATTDKLVDEELEPEQEYDSESDSGSDESNDSAFGVDMPGYKPNSLSQLLIDANLTESDSGSNFSDDYQPHASEDLASDASESMDSDVESNGSMDDDIPYTGYEPTHTVNEAMDKAKEQLNTRLESAEHIEDNQTVEKGTTPLTPPHLLSPWAAFQDAAPQDSSSVAVLPVLQTRSGRLPSPSDAAMPKSMPADVIDFRPFRSPSPQMGDPMGYNANFAFGACQNNSYSPYQSHFNRPEEPYPKLLNPPIQPTQNIHQFPYGGPFTNPYTMVPPMPSCTPYPPPVTPREPTIQPTTSTTRVTIDEIVDKNVPNSPSLSPAPSTLKRKASEMDDDEVETENNQNVTEPIVVVSTKLEKTPIDVQETTPIVASSSEEPPKKKTKVESSRSVPTLAKYAAVATTSALVGAFALFGALVSLPDDYFMKAT